MGGSVEEVEGDDDDDDSDVGHVEEEAPEEELVSPDIVQENVFTPSSLTHACVMCGKTFRHRDNLNVHVMQAHLSTKAKLRRCDQCNRY